VSDETPAWPLWVTQDDAVTLAASQEHGTLDLSAPCPACGRPVRPDERFCENCGADVHPEVVGSGPGADASETTVKFNRPRPALAPCLECGGEVDADGYCQTCGTKAPSARDHFESAPASWLGGVCDRGVLHHRNEDAMALWVSDEPQRDAVLVVCDGVSSSEDSDVAALAAAERARDTLAGSQPSGMGVTASHDAAMVDALERAAADANRAVVEHTAADSVNAASCTFAAAVLHGSRMHWACIGDSRVYFLSEATQLQLSTDHSVAEELIRAGTARAIAETSPQAHAITRWLGRDAGDVVPDTGVYKAGEDGWLVVCSDGLWNYASEASALAEQLDAACADDTEPVRVAGRLVKWANSQGGKDNVTVALARVAATLIVTPQAPSGDERPPAAASPASTSVEEKN